MDESNIKIIISSKRTYFVVSYVSVKLRKLHLIGALEQECIYVCRPIVNILVITPHSFSSRNLVVH
jgi:hypothetical protein